MSKNLYNTRLCVRRDDGYISSLWRLWITHSGDVYASTGGMGGIEKYSFHKSGICRSAFTKEHGTPPTMADRLIFKWTRNETPAESSNKASRVAWIAFPTDYLSKAEKELKKQITWIPAAPSGDATYVEFAYTRESEASVRNSFDMSDRDFVSYTSLPNAEAFLISYYHADWENRDLLCPGSVNSIFPNLRFSKDDPNETGRPVRMRFGPQPKDGEALVLRELGGYPEASRPQHRRS